MIQQCRTLNVSAPPKRPTRRSWPWLDKKACYRISAGSLVKTAIDIAREEAAAGREALIVALCCDGGDRYLSEHFWEN